MYCGQVSRNAAAAARWWWMNDESSASIIESLWWRRSLPLPLLNWSFLDARSDVGNSTALSNCRYTELRDDEHVEQGSKWAAVLTFLLKVSSRHPIACLKPTWSHNLSCRWFQKLKPSSQINEGSFFWLQNTEGLTLVGLFMEGTTLSC
jgi:hypothetical protein